MDILVVRRVARIVMSAGSLGVIVGGVLMFAGMTTTGDVIMIGGFVALILGVIALAQTPPRGQNQIGDDDAR